MTMAGEWLLTRASSREEAWSRLGHDVRTQHLTALTIKQHGMVGKAYRVHPVDRAAEIEELYELAVAASTRIEVGTDPGATGAVDVDVPEVRFTRPAWLQEIGRDTRTVSFTVLANGAKVHGRWCEDWIRLGHHGSLVARIPRSATEVAQTPSPKWSADRLLLPPAVLGTICLPALLHGLTAEDDVQPWPQARIVDPGWGDGPDLEGYLREPALLGACGRLVTRPADLRRAELNGLPRTGHGGLSALVFRDLVIGDGPVTALPPGRVVTEAMQLAGRRTGHEVLVDLTARGPAADPDDHFLVRLPHTSDLLDAGTWCGPWQRGPGPWTSPWLSVELAAVDLWMRRPAKPPLQVPAIPGKDLDDRCHTP
ncbi:hypothetical protein [Kribbella monticola]|uniref:hypothetical protein n=1 Tax=Kribbella monticola TaxID=2185285 RepID=UPI00130018B3|nr:hypothetical protein [Kribbella monticola]